MFCHFLLQGIFPSQESNLGLPHCGQILSYLSHKESPYIYTHTFSLSVYLLMDTEFGYFKQCCYEHWGTCIFSNENFCLFLFLLASCYMRLPWWVRQQSVCLQCERPRFNPWLGKIPWRRKWQPTPVRLPRTFHGLRSLVGYSPWGHNESDTTG